MWRRETKIKGKAVWMKGGRGRGDEEVWAKGKLDREVKIHNQIMERSLISGRSLFFGRGRKKNRSDIGQDGAGITTRHLLFSKEGTDVEWKDGETGCRH